MSEDEESVVKDCFIFCLTAGGDRYMLCLSDCKGEIFQSNVFFLNCLLKLFLFFFLLFIP